MTDTGTFLTFSVAGATFHCVVGRGVDQHYEWQTLDGGCRAGRNPGKGTYWAVGGGVRLGQGKFPSLRSAMLAAVYFRQLQDVRAAA